MAQRGGILVLVLVVVMAMVGCTPPPHIALDSEVVPLLTQVECKNVVIEDEVSVATDVSTGGQVIVGGLLGMMIDNSVNKTRSRKAEEFVLPLLEQTPDVDLRAQLGEALAYTLKEIDWLNIDDVRSTAATPNPDELKGITKPLLHLDTSYQLVPKCYSLDVTTVARIWLPGEKKPVFLGFYTYFSEPIGDVIDDAAVGAWAANGGAAYRAAVTDGVAEIVKMLRCDLPPDGNLPDIRDGDWTRIKFLEPSTNDRVKWNCTIIDKSEHRIIFRFENGNIWSIPTSLFEMDAMKAPHAQRADEF